MKTAMIWGVSGQFGSTMAEFLLDRGYEVIGVKRRSSTNNLCNLVNCIDNPRFYLEEADITDSYRVMDLLTHEPEEVYNAAAISHVHASFVQPAYAIDTIVKGSLNILDGILKLGFRTKYFHTSSSEMFGNSVDLDGMQRESTLFQPVSPYAVAKVAAHNLGKVYRDAYNMFVVNGILFNMESPRRGEQFVTRKITKWIGDIIKNNSFYKLPLGNINARRDWNHVKDSVLAAWTSLQVNDPTDYVIGSGINYSVEDFVRAALNEVGLNGNGDLSQYIVQQQRFLRPNELHYLKADASKARDLLGWSPAHSFADIVREMVAADCK